MNLSWLSGRPARLRSAAQPTSRVTRDSVLCCGQALVGLGGEDISRRGEAAEALARAVEKKEDAEARDRVAGMGAVAPLLSILREAVNGSPDDPDENTAAGARLPPPAQEKQNQNHDNDNGDRAGAWHVLARG